MQAINSTVGYRGKKDDCPGRIRKVSLKRWNLHWEESKKQKRGRDFIKKWCGGKVLVVDSKSKVEKTISYSLFSKLLIDYILCVCMCEQPIRARVPGKFRHQHLTGWMWCLWMVYDEYIELCGFSWLLFRGNSYLALVKLWLIGASKGKFAESRDEPLGRQS